MASRSTAPSNAVEPERIAEISPHNYVEMHIDAWDTERIIAGAWSRAIHRATMRGI